MCVRSAGARANSKQIFSPWNFRAMPVERRVVVYELLSAQISRHQWTRPAGLDRLQWDRPSGSAQGGLLEFELDAILLHILTSSTATLLNVLGPRWQT